MKIREADIKRWARRLGQGRARGVCPPEEVLASWAEKKLSETEKEKWLGHLSRCADCRETLLTLRELLSETAREEKFVVPASALARARKLDPARESVIEIVVKFAKGMAEVLRLSGEVLSGAVPAMEAVRGQGMVVSETLVTFTKDFPPYRAELEVEKTKPGQGEITVRITEPESGETVSGLRVSLFAGEEELESEAVEEGRAVFENIKFGRYRLEITKVGEPVGKIALEMKGE